MAVTIRNMKKSQSLAVVANAALKVGQHVKLIAGAAAGEPCKVAAATKTDLAAANVLTGIVTWTNGLSEAVDFNATAYGNLTAATGENGTHTIAAGEVCLFWYDCPVVGVDQFSVDASLVVATTREGTAVAFDNASGLLAPYDKDNAARDAAVGVVVRQDGDELTIALKAL